MPCPFASELPLDIEKGALPKLNSKISPSPVAITPTGVIKLPEVCAPEKSFASLLPAAGSPLLKYVPFLANQILPLSASTAMLMISLSEIETLVILSVLPLCRRSLLPPALFVIKDVAFIFASLEPTLESLANCKISESKFIPIYPLQN